MALNESEVVRVIRNVIHEKRDINAFYCCHRLTICTRGKDTCNKIILPSTLPRFQNAIKNSKNMTLNI